MASRAHIAEHVIIRKRAGRYIPFPQLDLLPDGRLAVGVWDAPFPSHYGDGDWAVMSSVDGGHTWMDDDDPGIPFNWPGSSTREKADRLAVVLPDGARLAAGTVGWEYWSAERRAEAEARRLGVYPHEDPDTIVVGGHRLFVQRSHDGGVTWERREWTVPECGYIIGFPRGIVLADGRTVLYPLREGDERRFTRQAHVWRSGDAGRTWRLRAFPQDIYQRTGDETALVEVEPGRVLALMRNANTPGGSGSLMSVWSDDAGLTWSRPLQTPIWGYPAHALSLQDGRILCTYGYRRAPAGIRACLSEDAGETWQIEEEVVLRDDGGTRSSLRPEPASAMSDLGYPITRQLPSGDLFTAYYFTTADGITHAAGTRWSLGSN